MKRWIKGLLWTLAGVAGFVLAVLVALQIILSPKVFTSLVNKYAPSFLVEGASLKLSNASVSIFSRFPAVSADIDDLLITYPAERYDSLERIGCQDFMVYAGTFRCGADSCACPMDTLASFKKFNVSLNVLPLLRGVVRIKNVELTHPHAFIHYYGDGSSNLEIFKLPSSETTEAKDTTEASAIKKVVLKRLFLGSDARIAYSNQRDSLHALMLLQTCSFEGRLASHNFLHNRIDFDLDSLLVIGTAKQDTVMFDLNHIHMNGGGGEVSLDAAADFHLATHAFGRIQIPLAFGGDVAVDEDRHDDITVELKKFFVEVAGLHLDTDMSVHFARSMTVKGFVDIPPVRLQTLLDEYVSHIVPECSKLSTDASLSARLDVDGFYDAATGELPQFDFTLDIPESRLSHKDYGVKPNLELSLTASAQQSGPVEAHLKKCSIDAPGIFLKAVADISDLLGEDPIASLDAGTRLELDKIDDYLPSGMGLSLGGSLSVSAKGKVKKSNLDLYEFGKADLDLKLNADRVTVKTVDDSLRLFCNHMSLKAGLMDNKFAKKRSSSPVRTFGALVKLDSLYFLSKGLAQVTGKDFDFVVQSSPDKVDVSDSVSYYPMMAMLRMASVFLEGEDSLNVRLKDSKNRVMVYPSRTDKTIPVVRVSSKNARLRAKMGHDRVFLRQLDFEADARMSGLARKRKLQAYTDSMFRAHPSWSRDSLMNYMRRNARHGRGPQWIKEDDFKSSDISIDLGESFRKLFLMWDVKGSLALERARVSTPAFPLKTSVKGFKGSFSNDKVAIDSLRIVSGASNLEARGAVTNLRRALMRAGKIKLDASLLTDSLAVSELLNAFAQGQKNMQTDLAYLANVDDDNYDKALAAAQANSSGDENTGLIVVPGNVDAKLSLRGKGVSYSNLNITDFNADILMRRHCLQILNTRAISTVGDVYLDAFYSTKSKKDLTTGFDLSLERIRAEDVIALIPQMDTIMPLLKTFGGELNCNIAATAQLDTNMNVLMPSINGVVRISGKDLHFKDNKKVEKVARVLLVRNPKRVTIDTMKVEGVVKDNCLEVFPFMLKIDRWSLALAGIQHLDQSFNYNISIMKSPILIKLGASISGPDFDHMKVKLGRPQYRNASLPTFSAAVDTTRINLRSSIRNIFVRGVERSVRDSRSQQAINSERARQNYSQTSASQPLEELSAADRRVMDSLSRVENFCEDSLRCAPVIDTIADPVRRAAFIDSLRVTNGLEPLAPTEESAPADAAATVPEKQKASRRSRKK